MIIKKIIVLRITPRVINFRINSFLLIALMSALFRFSNLYCLDVVIRRYVTNAVIVAMINVSLEIELDCITEPAKTGRIPHENIVDKLL